MDTSLQSTHLTADELSKSLETEGGQEEQEHHIHLPNPSLWPLILSVAILLTIAGLLFVPDNPLLAAVGIVLVFISIVGLGVEDPMKPLHETEAEQGTYRYFDPSLSSKQVLDMAREIVERNVTISSTAYSTHPVKVELESESDEGVVLALYGKVELEAQRDELEDKLLRLPNVIEVRNFIVAEDAILNIANARLENLRAKGKLEGARNISVLVENYILHLYGDVPDSDMKYMLEREMIGIPGVRVVVNHIGLNKDIPGYLGKTRNKI
jgi:hypothetical protein